MAIRVLIVSYITGSAPSRPDAELALGLHQLGVELDVMIPESSPYVQKFTIAGIRVIKAHARKKIDFKVIRLMRNEIKSRKYDIIHLFNSKAISNGSIAAAGLPVKVIAYRGAAGIHWYDPTAWLTHLNPRVDYIICNSIYVQKNVQKQLLFRPHKAVMIHKGMNIGWFKNVEPVDRKILRIPHDAIVVGCVANVRRIKGVPYLAEASRFIKPGLPIHFILIGNGMGSGKIQRFIASGNYKTNFHLLGFRNDIYDLITTCEIYVQPSLSESLSRSVMEAMCLGVPCIVSNVGGLKELIINDKSGLVVEKADARSLALAIEQLVDHPEQRETFARVARERMETIFSVKNMVENTLKFYEEIIQNKKSE